MSSLTSVRNKRRRRNLAKTKISASFDSSVTDRYGSNPNSSIQPSIKMDRFTREELSATKTERRVSFETGPSRADLYSNGSLSSVSHSGASSRAKQRVTFASTSPEEALRSSARSRKELTRSANSSYLSDSISSARSLLQETRSSSPGSRVGSTDSLGLSRGRAARSRLSDREDGMSGLEMSRSLQVEAAEFGAGGGSRFGDSALSPVSGSSDHDGSFWDRNATETQPLREPGWFCLTVGNTTLGAREVEFCTKLMVAGCTNFHHKMPVSLLNKNVRNSEEAVAEINSILQNPHTKNANACLMITKHSGGGLANVCNAFLDKIGFFVIDEAYVGKCLSDPTAMIEAAQTFCDNCLFPIDVETGQSELSSPLRNSNVSFWCCIWIGGRDEKLLSDFGSHFSRLARAKSFDLKDALACKCVANTTEAVSTLTELLQHPRTQTVASCIVFTSGNFDHTKSGLMRAFGQQHLQFCVFTENQLRHWSYDDAMLDGLIRDFTWLCKIERKESSSHDSKKADKTKDSPFAAYNLYPSGLPDHKLGDLCNRIENRTLLASSSELIQKLTVDGSFYKRIEVIAQTDTLPTIFNRIFKLVAAACKFNFVQFRQNVDELLQQLVKSPEFLRQATDKCIDSLKDQDFSKVPEAKVEQMKAGIKDYLFVLWQLLDRFPSSHSVVSGSVSSASVALKQITLQASPVFDKELSDLLDELEMKWAVSGSSTAGLGARKTIGGQEQSGDFRQVSVWPTKEDILNDPKLFDKDTGKGPYEGSEHYLDVQFKLLRENFIGPLRDGIRQFLIGEAKHVFIYRQVQIQQPTTDKKTGVLMYPVTFAPVPSVHWMNRLTYGSLVCLSSDNFQNDLLFATVADRTVMSLENGEVFLNFELASQATNELGLKDEAVYTMLEQDAIFQAHQHVLNGLQAIPKNHPIAFDKYLINCTPDVGRPEYLGHRGGPVQFTCLTGFREVVSDVFELQKWPSKEELGLDQSQFEALQHALTSELAIIRGPPATGKTFMGQLLTRLLVANESLWNPRKKHPILVVCHTNNALDLFAEGISKFANPDDFVRISGELRNENLMKYSLRNHRERKRHLMPQDVRCKLGTVLAERHKLEKGLNHIETTMKNLQKGVLLNSVGLENVINEKHSLQLFKGARNDDGNLIEWLTASSDCSTDNKNQRINLPLVRQLIELGFSEMAAKKALSVTGNNNLSAAYGYLIENCTNSGVMSNDNGTARWPSVNDVDQMMKSGFTEEAAVTALEIHGSVEKASEALVKAYGSDDEKDPLSDDAVSENAEEDQDEFYENPNDIEDDFRFLDEDFLSMFHDYPHSSSTMKNDAENLFFPVQPDQCESSNELIRLEDLRPLILSVDQMPAAAVDLVSNVWSKPLLHRWKLYKYWTNELKKQLHTQLREKEEIYSKVLQELRRLTSMSDRVLLQSAKVIAMTTTGAAENQEVLHSIQPRIVIMEEATEMPECHLITSLTEGCQHVILIGEHQPVPANTSLTERLISNGFKHTMLKMQHRMKPEISRAIMPHFYSDLQDYASVFAYDDVRGIEKSMMFLDHSYPEIQDVNSSGYLNNYEAEMAVGLACHLLKQDYKPKQITVLCTYLDQMVLVRNLMSVRHIEGVQVSDVDNYQGEQCDIVILSLVRSNSIGEIGFLTIKSQVCMALSRAKMGFYCIGNFSNLVQASRGSESKEDATPWPALVENLRLSGYMRNTIPVVCHMHGKRQNITQFKDFESLSPEGGCRRPCDETLRCGHVCKKLCHAYDPDHKQIPCSKLCGRDCAAGEHPCKKFCSEECGKCMVVVRKELLCGHKQEVPCYMTIDSIQCNGKCAKSLPCGHPCTNSCSDECIVECRQNVTRTLHCGHEAEVACCLNAVDHVLCKHKVLKTWPNCGHEVLAECHIDPITAPCQSPCGQPLPDCGHICQGTCGTCRQGRLHAHCNEDCNQILICGHECKSHRCGRPCPPCQRICETQCTHSKCSKTSGRRCGQMCPLCMENCGLGCVHVRCDLRCFEPCERQPCKQTCPRLLECGTDKPHPCIGVCGEPCPRVCRICHPEKMKEIKEIFFGNEDQDDARFIELEDCGHILEMTGIDSWIRTQMESADGKTNAIEGLCCPKCKKPIRKSLRYGKYLKQQMLDIAKIKLTMNGTTAEGLEVRRQKLIERLSQFVMELLNHVDILLSVESTEVGRTRILTEESIARYANMAFELEALIQRPATKHLTKNTIRYWSNVMQFIFKLGTFELYDLNRFRTAYDPSVMDEWAELELKQLFNQFFNCHLATFLEREHEFLLDWLVTNQEDLSETMMQQFSCEIQRLHLLAQICTVLFSAPRNRGPCLLKQKHYEDMTDVLNLLNGSTPINAEIEARCETIVMEWLEVISLAPGTGITLTERPRIVSAMGMNPGHWFKCPNGHVYTIDRFGRPDEVSKCPVCSFGIGDRQHNLAAGNRRTDRILFDQDFFD